VAAKGAALERRTEQLYDLLSDGDLTSDRLISKLDCSYACFMKTVQNLRDILAANGDVISVVAEPQGWGTPWLYGLRAGKQIVNAADSRWIPNRFQDAERRIKTIAHVLDVAAGSLDGRTIDAKKARIYRLHINRALEEVQMLAGDGAP
jgi:hypothetical protein